MRTIALLLLSAWLAPAAARAQDSAERAQPAPRRRIGVAFGGGSARGLAHVGVIRWFEEHRIPIDLIAGTSMGGLIGGAFASGMSAGELTALLENTDWDEMFGFSPFRFKNIRRKEDARSYPSRIEFGAKGGISGPVSLNNGQQVDLLLARIAGAYATLPSFDDLPTPFRAVAVDLVSAQQVVLDRGSLASALRATMSLPGIFPPVERDGQVLVDGGALNNVPADVVRGLGADVVVAVNVAGTSERTISRSILGLMGQTVDVMMAVNTRGSLNSADIVVNPPLVGFASLDWRRSAALAADGYQGAEAMKDRLLPLAVGEAEWNAYLERRQTRRRTTLPSPEFLTISGAVPSDQARMEEVLRRRVGQPLDVAALEDDLRTLAGLDRYETVGWRLVERDGRLGLAIDARPKANAPPFLMVGLALQNTTTDSFSLQVAARYLAFDVVGSGSEVRIDGAAGAQPEIAGELYRPIGKTPLFVSGFAGVRRRTLNFVGDEDIVVARYSEKRAVIGADAGVNIGRDADARVRLAVGRVDSNVDAGDPGLPELHGGETRGGLTFRYDGQDSPVVPSIGLRVLARLDHIFDAPDVPADVSTSRTNDNITQFELGASRFWTLRRRDRLFATLAAGATSGEPLPTEQFQLGQPFRLGAYDIGQFRGDHYAVLTGGYLRGIGRLPDFLGGPLFLGGWVENGSAFDDLDAAQLRTNVTIGALADTLVGPMLVGASFDFSGAWRYYLAIGRLF
jgi:NTE family protein